MMDKIHLPTEERKVSILLPTYNRANAIAGSIKSVISQTYKNWELIIADDCSSDNTKEVCKKYCEKDERIIFFSNINNMGLPKNRNKSLKKASGSLILFIEDDMVLDKNCVEILVSTFEELFNENHKIGAISPALITNFAYENKHRGIMDFARERFENKLKSNPCIIDKRTGIIYRNFSPEFEGIIPVEDSHSCSLYSRNIFDKIRYEENAYRGNYIGEESELHFKLIKMNYKLYFQPKAVMFHNVAESGGCRQPLYLWSYYYVRNHSIFLIRNYGSRSAYMIPSFVVFLLFTFLTYYKEKI